MESNITFFAQVLYIVGSTAFIILQGILWLVWWPADWGKLKDDVFYLDGPETLSRLDKRKILWLVNPRYFHQLVLNTVGSILGWVSGYILIFLRLSIVDPSNYSWSDLVLLIIFFYGATGYLPHIAVNKANISFGN